MDKKSCQSMLPEFFCPRHTHQECFPEENNQDLKAEADAFAAEQGVCIWEVYWLNGVDATQDKLMRARCRIANVYNECDALLGADLDPRGLYRRHDLLSTLRHLDYIMFMESTMVETRNFTADSNIAYWQWISHLSLDDPYKVEETYIRKLIQEYQSICHELKFRAEPELRRLRAEGMGSAFEEDR